MTIQVKSTLIVLATLFLGVLIGILASRWLHQPPQFKPREMRDPGGFIQFNERLIQPTAAQRDTIRKILVKYYSRLSALDRRHREELKSVVDSMRIELNPILTIEQRKRMEPPQPGAPPNGMDRRGPFPPGPPMDRPNPEGAEAKDFPEPPDQSDAPQKY